MKALALALWLGASSALAAPLAVPLGDDGLHKPDWLEESFLDLREDLEEAQAGGRSLLISIEQRGCIYCAKMHSEIFPDPQVAQRLRDDFRVIQVNLAGSLEVTDFDGSIATEKATAQAWGVNFTPTLIFLPAQVPPGLTAREAALAVLPGSPSAPVLAEVMDWVRAGGEVSGRTLKEVLSPPQSAN